MKNVRFLSHKNLISSLIFLLIILLNVQFATALVWTNETVDSSPYWVGRYTSIASDSSNNPHISYVGSLALCDSYGCYPALKHAWKNGLWNTATLESWTLVPPYPCNLDGCIGSSTSIAIGTDDGWYISYYDPQYGDLKRYSSCSAPPGGGCSPVEIIDSSGDVGRYNSIALDSNDIPHISYLDFTNHALKYYAGCVGPPGGGCSPVIETVDTYGSGAYTDIALDSNDNPHISYVMRGVPDCAGGCVKHAWRDNTGWHTELVRYPGEFYGSSIALDSNNNPHISFLQYTATSWFMLSYATKNGSTWQTEWVDTAGYDGGVYYQLDDGRTTSLVIDPSNTPHISYHYDAPDYVLKYATKSSGVWYTETVNGIPGRNYGDDAGWYNSIALDSNNSPHISYMRVDGTLEHAYVPPAPPPPIAGYGPVELVGKGAWPEHKHYSISRDDDGFQTLYAKVENNGWINTAAAVEFRVQNGSAIGTFTTGTKTIPAYGKDVFSFNFTPPTVGKYTVDARTRYDYNGDGSLDAYGADVDTFTFTVVS